ncbi:protein transport protein SEC31-like [Varroa jacobsoni]|uniref:FERM domain-containing protein n=1 Tax=Varroa destructor TaxID=109461 RepID=A0A7M7KU11_VARDE|nr:protein transport protein SEC31-like [Varroa destructor]XP_022671957.1 protein transport protein SEC31-like [Varroa destructor]XP_022691294.1 protein transport protein SEC31-like [Varroa jacobsoni]XP_022691295.1 protein transport protein SEC31-like [Varroa jacobsoni]
MRMEASARCEIDLLGERRIDTQIDEKLIAEDLLNLAASHLKLRERELFGLSWQDEDGHLHWLQPEKLVLDQVTENCIQQGGSGEAPRVVLHLMIKFYVPTIALLADAATVEAFFMQAKLLMSKDVLEPDSQTEYRLTALALQANFGDWTRDDDAKLRLRQMGFPSPSLTKHKSVDYCERKILEDYRSFLGFTRGNAVIQYMNTVEGLATYGIHFYKVQQKDRNGPMMWIGLSHRGLSEYDLNNRKVPKKFYQWKYMENIYYRETKFSIEINNPKSSTSMLSGNASVIVWYAANAALNKTIWSMAIAQHQFHMDSRRARKQTPEDFLRLQRISQELNNPSQMTIRSSLSRIALAFEGRDDDKATTEVKLSRLSVKKSALVEILRKKLKELQEICKKEADITGAYDSEMPSDNDIANPTLRKAKPLVDRNANEVVVTAPPPAVLPPPPIVQMQSTMPQKPVRPPPPPHASTNRRIPPPLPPSHSLDRLKARSPVLSDLSDSVDSGSIGIVMGAEGGFERPRSNTLGRDFGRHASSSLNLRVSPRSSMSSTSTSPIPPLAAYSAPSSPKSQRSDSSSRYVPSLAQQSTHTSYRRSQYPPVYRVSRADAHLPCKPPAPGSKTRAPSPLLEARSKYEGPFERVNLYSVKTQRLSQAFSSHDNIPGLLQPATTTSSKTSSSSMIPDGGDMNTPGLPSLGPLAGSIAYPVVAAATAMPPPPPPPPLPRHTSTSSVSSLSMASSSSTPSSSVPPPPPPPPPPQPKLKKEWTETDLDEPIPLRRSPLPPPALPTRDPPQCSGVAVASATPVAVTATPASSATGATVLLAQSQAQPSTVVRTSAAATQVVVEAGKFKPYYEESKPFEMSDFYKYSQRHRKS